MSGCSENKYTQMLHAYELGILGIEERAELELHLLSCNTCFEKLAQFEKEAALLRDDSEMQTFVIDLHDSTLPAHTKTTNVKKILHWSLAAAAIITLMVLSPWQLEFIPTQEAMAIENKLMVFEFENVSHTEDTLAYGAMTANLLITDLVNTQELQVISYQRILDVISRLGYDKETQLNAKQIFEIGRFLNVRWIVTGEILKTDQKFSINSQLIEMPNGNLVAAQKIESLHDETIFSLIDKLTDIVKNDLSLHDDNMYEPTLSVAEITTTSEDAYRYYLHGVDNYNRFYYKEARRDLEKALEFDSTFAMAYYYLSFIKSRSYINKAQSYATDLNLKEKSYIASRVAWVENNVDSAKQVLHTLLKKYPNEKDAYYQLGSIDYYYDASFDSAILNLTQVVKIDPFYKPAYNLLTYCYTMKDNYEQAIITADKYLTLDSTSANPYDTKGDLNAFFGKLDEAILSYKKALTIKPDFYSSLYMLGYMYLYQGDFEKADSCLQALAQVESKQLQSSAKMYLTYLPIRKGQYLKALKELSYCIAEEKDSPDDVIYKYFLQTVLTEGFGDIEHARIRIDKVLLLSQKAKYTSEIDYLYYKMYLLSLTPEKTKIVPIVDSLGNIKDQSTKEYFTYWFGKGLIEFSNKNYDSAAMHFLKSVSQAIEKNATGYYVGRYMAARSYYLGGDLSNALEIFENMESIYTSRRLFWSVWDNKVPYYLGRIYEDSRWHEKAIDAYELYLSNMEHADIDIADAKKRIEKLKNID